MSETAAEVVELEFQSTRSSRSGTSITTSIIILTHFNPPAPRGAGPRRRSVPSLRKNFNPPAPRGAGLSDILSCGDVCTISIHPLLAERDRKDNAYNPGRGYFNPPAPRGAGPTDTSNWSDTVSISIHPLLAERDIPCWRSVFRRKISIHPLLAERDGFDPLTPGRGFFDFNPPAPRGAGPQTRPIMTCYF